MAKVSSPQDYPRIQDESSRYSGYLDDATLVPHKIKIPLETLKEAIRAAIYNANSKSGREILSIPSDATDEEIESIYKKAGYDLLTYFAKYSNDPASVAHQINGKNYRDVGVDLFRNKTLQKERMNSAWRYQYLTIYCAHETGRFSNISDIGTNEGDFSAKIRFVDSNKQPLNMYVSVKNRSNTVGGQDMPKVIQALEEVAKNDKNRVGPYICVLGVTIERGQRSIRRNQKKIAYSVNTEMWLADFYWPFFTNCSYEEIMLAVLDVLSAEQETDPLITQVEVPDALLTAFGEACRDASLIDELGNFNDAPKIVRFLCNPPAVKTKRKKSQS